MKRIPDSLWCEIEKLLPKKNTAVGRPEFDNKKTFEGVLYVLRTGIQWCELPEKYGCFTTVHGKYMRWARVGVFEKMMVKAREYYRRRNSKNIWYALDTLLKKAPLASFGGKNPTDRAKRGIKQAVLVDRKGAPLFVSIAPANIHDSNLLEPTIKKMRKSKKVRILATDSAWDSRKARNQCKTKNIALIASTNRRRQKNAHKFNSPYRWIVEQIFGILSWYRGLKICWAKTRESALGFLQIACSLRLFKMAGIFG